MKSMLILATTTGFFIAGLLLIVNRSKRANSKSIAGTNESSGQVERNMKFAMG